MIQALDDIDSLNSENEWLAFLEGKLKKEPYLKAQGRLNKKPKVKFTSSAQRRIANG